MDRFEINKIIAAILATVLIVFSIDKFTDIFFRIDKPQQSAYKVEKIEPSLASSSSQVALGINELLALETFNTGKKFLKSVVLVI